MKYKITLLVVLFLFSCLFFSNCQKTPGVQMVQLPVKNDPTISFRILFKVGSQNDPTGKEGLAALTAALIAEGSTQKHSFEEITEMLYPMASSINSQVDKEMTVIYGRTHIDNLEEFYKVLKEVVMEPAFKEEDFQRVKTNTLNYLEKTLRYSDDEELGKEVLSEFVFVGTPYEHIEEGHISSVKNITLEDVKSFYKKYFNRNNVIIKPINGFEVLIVEKDANATAISFGFPIDVIRGRRDYYALAIANSWLGEHRNSSSHLYQVIREARGLNYGDYSYIEHFPHGGQRQFPPANVARRQQMFQVWIRPVPNYAKLFAFRAALRELQKLVDNGMSEEEFELTRKFLKNYVLHYAPTTMMKLGYALDDVFYGIKGSHLKLFRDYMDHITRDEVNEAIRRYLQYQNIKVVFVTNEAEKLKEMLVNNTSSPIKYQTPKPQSILEEDEEIANYPLNIQPENVKIISVEEVFQ